MYPPTILVVFQELDALDLCHEEATRVLRYPVCLGQPVACLGLRAAGEEGEGEQAGLYMLRMHVHLRCFVSGGKSTDFNLIVGIKKPRGTPGGEYKCIVFY